mgnify:CR=1 FL=1
MFNMFGMSSNDIGIDLGTASILVYIKGKGVVLKEPSVVAIDRDTNRILAIGEEARLMIGRTPGNIIAIRPLRHGVISDYTVTEKMLKYFINKAVGKKTLLRPRIAVCIPSGATEVERKAVEDATYQAGAKEVTIIEEPVAAAIGAGIDISKACGNMIVDIGGGTTEVAVISLSAVAYAESVRIAGDEINDCIQRYVQDEFKLLIGENMAEASKMQIASAVPPAESMQFRVAGKNLVDGTPKSIVLTDAHVREAIREPVNAIVAAVRRALEKTPPELVADIATNGLLLAGGGALLKGLDKLITQESSLLVHIDDDPLTTVVRGTGRAMEDPERFGGVYIN